MTVSKAVAAEIRRLYFAEHWKRGTIAAQLGVHFDVVVRVLGSFGPKGGSPRPDARVLEPYIPFVDETLSRYPRLVATRIQDMLVERGYEGSVRTLRRYVREARPAPRNEVFLRVETLPGEQAQVDWAHVGSLPVPGGHRALWAFVMVLAYSRAMWAELVVDLGVDSLCRSLVRAVAFFGGCTRQWLFDNAKTIVIERSGDAVRFHPTLLDLASHLHVQPALCGPRKPQEKGRSSERSATSRNDSSRRARFTPCSTATRSSSSSSRPSPIRGRTRAGLSDAWSTCSTRNARACSPCPSPCRRPTRSAPSPSTRRPS